MPGVLKASVESEVESDFPDHHKPRLRRIIAERQVLSWTSTIASACHRRFDAGRRQSQRGGTAIGHEPGFVVAATDTDWYRRIAGQLTAYSFTSRNWRVSLHEARKIDSTPTVPCCGTASLLAYILNCKFDQVVCKQVVDFRIRIQYFVRRDNSVNCGKARIQGQSIAVAFGLADERRRNLR